MLAAGWAAVTIVAMFVAWRGVTVVADEVTESRPSSLSDDEVAKGAGDATTSTSAGRTSSTATTGGSSAPPGSQPPSPGATAAPSPPGPTGSPGSPANPAPTTAPPTNPPATAAPPPPPSETRTYDLVGGTVVVRFNGDGTVGLVSSQPKPGFERELHDTGPGTVDVGFESETHKSRLVARWEDGTPSGEVQEDADDGGDD